MFCEPCRRERPFSRFCVLCGSVLVKRDAPLIQADLERVRWLLSEVEGWDESVAPRSARRAISEFYGRQQDALVAALAPEPRSAHAEARDEVEVAAAAPSIPLSENAEIPQAPPSSQPESRDEVEVAAVPPTSAPAAM